MLLSREVIIISKHKVQAFKQSSRVTGKANWQEEKEVAGVEVHIAREDFCCWRLVQLMLRWQVRESAVLGYDLKN